MTAGLNHRLGQGNTENLVFYNIKRIWLSLSVCFPVLVSVCAIVTFETAMRKRMHMAVHKLVPVGRQEN